MSLQELKYTSVDLLQKYIVFLHRKPVLTKSITSALVAGLGDAIYQLSKRKDSSQEINYRSIAAFAGSGLLVTGPLNHYFYILLDRAVPTGSKWASLSRLLIERLLFSPVYLLLMLYIRFRLEGASQKDVQRKLYRSYLPILKMSYKVWTVAQFININHVPQQYRVLFTNFVTLGWTVYLASMKEVRRNK